MITKNLGLVGVIGLILLWMVISIPFVLKLIIIISIVAYILYRADSLVENVKAWRKYVEKSN